MLPLLLSQYLDKGTSFQKQLKTNWPQTLSHSFRF